MPKDLAYDNNLSEDPKKSIKSGFLWLGIASTLSQILGAVTMVIAMIFMTKEDIGIATLALSFAVIVEAFNSLGTNQALLQAKTISPEETHSVFWFASAFGIAILLIALPLAWPVAYFYNNNALIPLFITSMVKLPLVCTAAVPLQLINRRLEYQKISAINTLTMLTCSILKITLAICGLGAWSLVIGDTAYGLGTLTGAFICSKYRPKFHFKWSECKRFINFGIKTCLSNAISQFNKNLHFLIVGKFLGEGVLGIYKIAYELAMTPALALFVVVTKSSFPVFSKLQDKRDELTTLFQWNQKNIALFAAIAAAAILFIAEDIFGLIPKPEWMQASTLIPYLLALSFFRSIMLAYPDLHRACGRPDFPIYTELMETVLFTVVCTALIYIFPSHAMQAMICGWIALHIIYFIVHCKLSQRFIQNSLWAIFKSMLPGFGFFIFASALSIPAYIFRTSLPYTNWTHLFIEIAIILISLALYARFILKVSFKDLFKKKNQPKPVV